MEKCKVKEVIEQFKKGWEDYQQRKLLRKISEKNIDNIKVIDSIKYKRRGEK